MLIKYPQNIFFILFLINITSPCFAAAGISEQEHDPMFPLEEEEGEIARSAYYRQNKHRDSEDELNSPFAKILSPKSNPGILSSPELLFSIPPRNTEDIAHGQLQQEKATENTELLDAPEIPPASSSAGIASPPPLRHFSKRKSEPSLEADEDRESKSLKLFPQEELASEAPWVKKNKASSSHQKGSKAYECEICEKQFTNKSDLTKHMRTHTGEKPFACTQCDQKFTQKVNLKQHILTHTGEKPFACTQCGNKFTQKSDLTKHMRIHTGEKPFACTQCDKKFTQKSPLIRHRRTHMGEKPFACTECHKKFSDKSNLTRHMRTHE